MSLRLLAGTVGAALAAGPWPDLPGWVFFPRALLWVLSLLLLRRQSQLLLGLSLLSLAAAAVDVRARALPSTEQARRLFRERLHQLQGHLSQLSQTPAFGQLLAGTGAEAEPETPFRLLANGAKDWLHQVDGLVLVDGRGEAVAWAGERPRLPLLRRPIGDRAVLSEAWVREVVVWCREPVYESGRVVGSLLASVGVPKGGTRQLLGSSAGWSAVWVPVLGDEETPSPPDLQVRPAPRHAWAASGAASVLALALLAGMVSGQARRWLALAAAGWAVMVGWLPLGLAPALLLLACAGWLSQWKSPSLARLTGAGVAGFAAWAIPPLLAELGHPVHAVTLLPPPLVLVGNLAALVALLLAIPAPAKNSSLAWVSLPLLFLGLATASGVWLGSGVLVLALATPQRSRKLVATAGVAAALAGGGDGVGRSVVLARTESTLARWGEVRSVARALIASLPEGRLEALSAAKGGRRLVLLGELAELLQLGEVLPGTALVLEGPEGVPLATWGEVGLLGQGTDQELAVRALAGGFRLRLLAPPSPHDVLAALAASGVGVPVAAFDRAGAAVARGAPFRPLPPGMVGEALARERWWGETVVGSRSVPTYLRRFGDWVLAVPWLRLSLPELLLWLAGLSLWVGTPLYLWEFRHRLVAWWRQRATFSGRLRVLALTVTFLPLLLLANVLPRQWVRERQQARLEMARALSTVAVESPAASVLGNLVRHLGVTVAVYRPSFLAVTSRPDLAMTGELPLLPPPEAYVRAVRRWAEPVVQGAGLVSVFLPVQLANGNLVVAVLGITELTGSRFSPAEWFAVTGLLAVFLSLWAAEVLTRRLAEPMERLVDAAERLGRGEPVPGLGEGVREDEFSTLARAFAHMAAEVQARQEELKRERDLLERVLEQLSAAVLVVEGERVVLANDAAKKLGAETGIQPLAESFGLSLKDLFLDPSLSGPRSRQISPQGRADALWNLTTVPLPGEQRRVLVVLEDLSEVARAERLASLTELARIVAHEVKNPLTPIRLWVEELEAALNRSPEEVVEVARLAVQEILQQVSRLQEVSQGFSNLVALERWEAQEVDVVELVAQVVEEYRVLARRGVLVEMERPATPILVKADPSWVQRALRHLLENSTKALGPRSGRIGVQVSREREWAVVAVADTAGGVAEEHLPRLFEPHFSTTSQGSGLGLAVVRRVCQKAGGRAEARNLPQGLEVRMLLPVAP
ncbi:MAG: ATP-binding protein [Thermoanaerobaculum sp.]|nr:ATP-binding protein [Thermoanaerobaculum sp.]